MIGVIFGSSLTQSKKHGVLIMNRMIVAIKKIKLSKILIAFFAGALLIFNTACSNGSVQARTTGDPGAQVRQPRQDAPAGKLAVPGKPNPRPEVPEDAKNNKSFERGTMNEFSDVQPGTKGLDAANQKAKALIDNAERNVIDETGDVGETTKRILDKKGQNVDDLGRNLNRSAEDAQDQAKGAAKDVTEGLPRETGNIFNSIKDSAQDTTTNLTKGAKRAAEDATDNAKQAARGTQRAVNKAGAAVEDAVD